MRMDLRRQSSSGSNPAPAVTTRRTRSSLQLPADSVEEIEKYYRNKNYVKPKPRALETIREISPDTKDNIHKSLFGAKRMRRIDATSNIAKEKMRARRAKPLPGNRIYHNRRKMSDKCCQRKIESSFAEHDLVIFGTGNCFIGLLVDSSNDETPSPDADNSGEMTNVSDTSIQQQRSSASSCRESPDVLASEVNGQAVNDDLPYCQPAASTSTRQRGRRRDKAPAAICPRRSLRLMQRNQAEDEDRRDSIYFDEEVLTFDDRISDRLALEPEEEIVTDQHETREADESGLPIVGQPHECDTSEGSDTVNAAASAVGVVSPSIIIINDKITSRGVRQQEECSNVSHSQSPVHLGGEVNNQGVDMLPTIDHDLPYCQPDTNNITQQRGSGRRAKKRNQNLNAAVTSRTRRSLRLAQRNQDEDEDRGDSIHLSEKGLISEDTEVVLQNPEPVDPAVENVKCEQFNWDAGEALMLESNCSGDFSNEQSLNVTANTVTVESPSNAVHSNITTRRRQPRGCGDSTYHLESTDMLPSGMNEEQSAADIPAVDHDLPYCQPDTSNITRHRGRQQRGHNASSPTRRRRSLRLLHKGQNDDGDSGDCIALSNVDAVRDEQRPVIVTGSDRNPDIEQQIDVQATESSVVNHGIDQWTDMDVTGSDITHSIEPHTGVEVSGSDIAHSIEPQTDLKITGSDITHDIEPQTDTELAGSDITHDIVPQTDTEVTGSDITHGIEPHTDIEVTGSSITHGIEPQTGVEVTGSGITHGIGPQTGVEVTGSNITHDIEPHTDIEVTGSDITHGIEPQTGVEVTGSNITHGIEPHTDIEVTGSNITHGIEPQTGVEVTGSESTHDIDPQTDVEVTGSDITHGTEPQTDVEVTGSDITHGTEPQTDTELTGSDITHDIWQHTDTEVTGSNITHDIEPHTDIEVAGSDSNHGVELRRSDINYDIEQHPGVDMTGSDSNCCVIDQQASIAGTESDSSQYVFHLLRGGSMQNTSSIHCHSSITPVVVSDKSRLFSSSSSILRDSTNLVPSNTEESSHKKRSKKKLLRETYALRRSISRP